MPGKDRELEAIGSIVALLTPLDEAERSRVLEYVLKRLQMATVRAPAVVSREANESPARAVTSRAVMDIRTLTAEKQPRSANEMAALVAYYLSELAPESERSETVDADKIRKYFKMAAFPLPRVLRLVLSNASAAGYLEGVGRGEYQLNPVGYNLVVHGLPRSSRSGVPAPSSQRARRPAAKKKRKTAGHGR